LNEFTKAHQGIHLCLGDSEKNIKKNICARLNDYIDAKNITIETAESALMSHFTVNKQNKCFCRLNDNKV